MTHATLHNRCLPVSEWPEQDQTAWAVAVQPYDPFDSTVGLAAGWARATQDVQLDGEERLIVREDDILAEIIASAAHEVVGNLGQAVARCGVVGLVFQHAREQRPGAVFLGLDEHPGRRGRGARRPAGPAGGRG